MNAVSETTTSDAVVLSGVGKTFRQRRGEPFRALHGVDLRVRAGEIHGLLGRNGAGKSTLVKLICGLQQTSEGTVRTLGIDPAHRRRELTHQIGVVFGQKSSLWWDLSVTDNLAALASLYKVPKHAYDDRRARLIDGLNLGGVLDRPIRQLSLGERVKSELAGALLHGPRLLVLDEPTIGLDLVSKRQLRRWLSTVARENDVAVLLTSHDTADIAVLCQNVTLLEQGQVAFAGTVDGLRDTMHDRVSVQLSARERPLADAELVSLQRVSQWSDCAVEVAGDRGSVRLSGPAARHDDLIKVALELEPAKRGLTLESMSPTLEDALLSRFDRTER